MKPTPRLADAVLVGIALQFVFVRNAHAYLDAGTASLVFQAIVATVLGGLLVFRIFWRKRVAGVKRVFSSKKPDDSVEG